ncbi:hypothetical protein F5882DRAFT_489962 [Hyaloscypha sp. PMI_1271]|nr:hypothetical protein F5882DRAFT_489962 [Hyaloscypha sp. PMI_1271]
MDAAQAMYEATLRCSPRQRSPDKFTGVDTVMDGVVPRSKSPSRVSPERTSRSRSPIRKSPKKPIADTSRLNLFGHAFQEQSRKVVSNNSSEFISAVSLNFGADQQTRVKDGSKSSLQNPPKSADWVPATESFPQPFVNKAILGPFSQPSSHTSHTPLHPSPQNQPLSQTYGLFGPPVASKSPLSFNHSPFQSRTLFGHPNNVPTTRELFSIPLRRSPKKLILPSFVDPLDEEIGNWNPEYQVSSPSPPPGILNMPYNANGEEELPDALDSRWDTDWDERLFDPVPGAGIYLGELRDPDKTPKYQNVMYASLGLDGEVEVKARPYNRTGKKVTLKEEGEVKFKDIEFRACFGGGWVRCGDMGDVKRCAKGRLDRKKEFDLKREKRFEEDVRRFWRNKKFNTA